MEFNKWAKILLWLGMIAEILKIVLLFVVTSNGGVSLNMTNSVFVFNLGVLVVSVVGYVMLLFLHKKIGFYLIAGSAAIVFVINLLYGTVTLKVFSRTILTVLLIYYVIRNQWDELE